MNVLLVLFQHSNQDIRIETSFMRFVNHDYRIVGQEWIQHTFSKQHSICHVFYPGGIWICFFIKSNTISDGWTQRSSHFLGDSFGYRCCSYTPRLEFLHGLSRNLGEYPQDETYLCARNHTTFRSPTCLMKILRDFYIVWVPLLGHSLSQLLLLVNIKHTSCLSRTSLSNNDHDLVLFHQVQ